MGILRKLHEFLFRPKELTPTERMVANLKTWREPGQKGLTEFLHDREEPEYLTKLREQILRD
jgi:hypothetical protein